MKLTTLYDDIVAKVTALGADIHVTLYTISLGSPDAKTGIPAITYSAGTTIEMPIFSKAAQQMLLGSGIYVRLDAVGLTKTTVHEGDRILDRLGNYYAVISIKSNPVGDLLIYNEVALVLQPWIL